MSSLQCYKYKKVLSWHRDDFEKRFVLADDDDLGEAPNYKLFPKHVTNVLDHPLDVGQQYWQPNGISFFGLDAAAGGLPPPHC